jgi:hypothetical protein
MVPLVVLITAWYRYCDKGSIEIDDLSQSIPSQQANVFLRGPTAGVFPCLDVKV